jgi:hypothetical protein
MEKVYEPIWSVHLCDSDGNAVAASWWLSTRIRLPSAWADSTVNSEQKRKNLVGILGVSRRTKEVGL